MPPRTKYPEPKPGDVYNSWKLIGYSHKVGCAQYWKCKCLGCNTIHITSWANIVTEKSRNCSACGALAAGESKHKVIPLGTKSGKLTVTGETKKDGHYYVICDCKCGTKDHPVKRANFVNETTRSCGCLTVDRGGNERLPPYRPNSINYKPKQRDLDMARMKLEGKTLKQIADIYKVSRQRVKQVINQIPPYIREQLENNQEVHFMPKTIPQAERFRTKYLGGRGRPRNGAWTAVIMTTFAESGDRLSEEIVNMFGGAYGGMPEAKRFCEVMNKAWERFYEG